MSVEARQLALDGVFEITPARFSDERGFFSETFNRDALPEAIAAHEWVQDNHSFSRSAGVLRGLHFQTPPHAQAKLVRVTRGAVWDVVVDIRQGSPTFGQWEGLELSAQAWNQIFVPVGYAHGFITMSPDTEVLYKVSAPYAPECSGRIRHDDPDLAIDWPTRGGPVILSQADTDAPRLSEIDTGFVYERG